MINIVIIYPLDVSLDNKKRPEDLIIDHTEEEWIRMRSQIRACVESYEDVYGIKFVDVNRFNSEFIKIDYEIVDQVKLSEQGDKHPGEAINEMLCHDLFYENCPSFYPDNQGNKRLIVKFVTISFGEINL